MFLNYRLLEIDALDREPSIVVIARNYPHECNSNICGHGPLMNSYLVSSLYIQPMINYILNTCLKKIGLYNFIGNHVQNKNMSVWFLKTFRPPSKNEEDEQKRIQEKKREKIMLLREVQRSPSPDAQLVFITQLDREAMSRSSRRTRSDITSERPPSELKFNPFHLERFEKIRNKQKKKFFAKIQL